jgi:outer membrane protein OmpA-like peptidoglycan-associated protein
MKKISVLMLSCLAIAAAHAQTMTTTSTTTVKEEKYTVSGGLLGAVNLSEFRLTGSNPSNVDYDMETGWGAGLWLNLPVAKWFSIEPQVQFNSLRYDAGSSASLLLNKGKIQYVTVPLLLKFHAGKAVAITAGPQVDFMTKVRDDNNIAQEDDFNQTSFSLTGGLELFPHGRVTVFGRYVHGISNMDERGTEVSDTKYKNQNIQAGLKIRLFGGKKDTYRATTTTVVVLDRDGDGISDDMDRCPDQAGTSKYNGCPIPDSDGDGINDELDKCPNQSGLSKYDGCPIPDTDGDGINDELDKCPTQAGTAARNGCPATDRDNDGINDDEDRCPDIAGTSTNRGCPDVPANVSKTLGASAQKITFGTGSNNVKLTTSSNASLNQIVTILNENPGLRVRVEAHTNSVGDDATNMTLSENRAAAVKTYLVSKGISEDRITTQGFGETMPIADNNTASGRTKNNRVEVKVDY